MENAGRKRRDARGLWGPNQRHPSGRSARVRDIDSHLAFPARARRVADSFIGIAMMLASDPVNLFLVRGDRAPLRVSWRDRDTKGKSAQSDTSRFFPKSYAFEEIQITVSQFLSRPRRTMKQLAIGILASQTRPAPYILSLPRKRCSVAVSSPRLLALCTFTAFRYPPPRPFSTSQ